MKVRVLPDGTMEFDATPVEAVELMQAQQAKTRERQQLKREVEASRAAEGNSLDGVSYRTWSWLVDNDTPEGIHISRVAAAFGLSNTTANQRLLTLVQSGYAKRVHRGYYRTTEPQAEAEVHTIEHHRATPNDLAKRAQHG